MPPLETITLHLTASSIEAYCNALTRRSATLEKRVAALDALMTFIATQTDAGEQAKAEFAAIRQTLHTHFELAHAALLAERTERLQRALSSHHLPTITTLYSSLSRDAFWTLLGRVVERLEAGQLSALRSWAADWMMAAKQRAKQATPYPDAIDFGAAGIDASEYLAMSDLCRYLGVE
ncbi:MAG TPA: hypothetical protein VGE50_00025 [Gammaproteobacteria bacterium]